METNRQALDIADLIVRHRNNNLSKQEQEELEQWANATPGNRELYDSLMQEQEALEKELNFFESVNVEAAWQKVARATGQPVQAEVKVIPLWQRFVVWRNAAAILLIVGLAGVFYHFNYDRTSKITPATIAANTIGTIQKQPESTVLILQDGSTIDLDSLHTGTLKELNGVKVISETGVLKIDASALTAPTSSLIAYNTITTPKGKHYQVVLPDGSKVWLNAASSLKFPTAFTGEKRRVELTGEAYFEVVKDMKQFIVATDDMDVTVLGTSFNVSAYADDKHIATTLVTGHVQLSGNKISGVTNLTPGKRAVYSKAGRNLIVSTVETGIYTVWKDGKLYFEEAALEEIITKLSRWYDFEPAYLDNYSRNKTFTGVALMDKPIDHVLQMISQTTNVTFEKKGDKLLIKKK